MYPGIATSCCSWEAVGGCCQWLVQLSCQGSPAPSLGKDIGKASVEKVTLENTEWKAVGQCPEQNVAFFSPYIIAFYSCKESDFRGLNYEFFIIPTSRWHTHNKQLKDNTALWLKIIQSHVKNFTQPCRVKLHFASLFHCSYRSTSAFSTLQGADGKKPSLSSMKYSQSWWAALSPLHHLFEIVGPSQLQAWTRGNKTVLKHFLDVKNIG